RLAALTFPGRPPLGGAFRENQPPGGYLLYSGGRAAFVHELGCAARLAMTRWVIHPTRSRWDARPKSASTTPAAVYSGASAATGSPNSLMVALVTGLMLTSCTSLAVIRCRQVSSSRRSNARAIL